MFKTTTVSDLRADIASCLNQLKDGPLVVLSHSRPAAVLVEPEMFEALLEKVEMLEDLLEGRHAMQEYLAEPTSALDAEEVFTRLGFTRLGH